MPMSSFRILTFCILVLFLSLSFQSDSSFLSEQLRYSRVREAKKDKEAGVTSLYLTKGLKLNSTRLFFVAYKEEQLIEIYAKDANSEKYQLLKTYSICYSSGKLGPKMKQGDSQVPEGFYHINRFNPSSNFHLSLGINYPNNADKKRSSASKLGGDIFIHGSCVSIGCLAMTDDKIKEIYWMAINAKNNGQSKIPVYIFPFKMSNSNYEKYKKEFAKDVKTLELWSFLKQGYDSIIQGKPIDYSISVEGKYVY